MEFIKKHISQILVHLLFWLLFTFVSLFVFSEYYWSENPFLQYLSILVIIVYTNNFIILPFFVKRRQYVLYAVLFILISFLATQLYCNVFTKCGCSFMKCLSDYLWQTIVPLIFFSFIWMLFKYLEREEEIENALKERSELELKFLKSQINPHVLFNNLNTVYSYSIEKPEQTPDLILKLSDNLKHVLYESTEDYISLEKEIQYIDNYIDFQKIRTQGIKEVLYDTSIDSFEHKIAPLLLITIIENAFKHSPPNSKIKIKISVSGDVLECFIQNEISSTSKENDYESIGLSNLKKRLELLYYDNYLLNVLEKNTFTVTLRLNLI
ncbi:histidine kinase [Tenacibaculum skagerrakense]|uniref:Histidine kinase n=2 Tax=Tenacibaculum skagerrakense TaxID=186571 RepID=A0A4R2P1Q8_9FLAO|nr:histidine kinase [Tenacibaculum skagerrakense]